MSHQEEVFWQIFNSSGGTTKIASAMESVLYNSAPEFVRNVKERIELRNETFLAATEILGEELNKGRENLYNRIQDRVDNYWRNQNVVE